MDVASWRIVKIYINEIPLIFHKVSSSELSSFDTCVPEMGEMTPAILKGNVLLETASFVFLGKLLDVLQEHKPKGLKSVTIPIEDTETVKKYVKSRYFFVKAAGGLVRKEGNFLFIFRLKKWDLPKGKLEKGESIPECAVREVEEECSIAVRNGPKIGSTWHCYATKNGWYVKKSTWFLMECLDDSHMQPQYQEDIEEIAWVAPESVGKYLSNSYSTIQDVFRKARKKKLI